MTAERLANALEAAGLTECPKCHGLFPGRHSCYEDSFDALLRTLQHPWALGAILSSHTGYEYTVVLNRNVSGAHGNGRVAIGMAFASYREALERAIAAAAAIDADPTIIASDKAEIAYLREPEA